MSQIQKKKKSQPAAQVKKPYLTGAPIDKSTPKTALFIFGSLLVVMILYLILGGMTSSGPSFLTIALNIALLLLTWMVYFYSGQSSGSIAVNQGEIMYHRQETDREISPDELKRCYHPLKGLIAALIGTAPFFLATLVLALITKRQMSSPGALPSWVTSLTTRGDLIQPLTVYTQIPSIGLISVLRIPIRMAVMPWINLIGSADPDKMLILERVAPLLILLPALCYGFGYRAGTTIRTKVHTDIAANRRAKARKDRARKKRQQARNASRQPQQLN